MTVTGREHALVLLESLRHKLSRSVDPVRLTSEERRYLLAACNAALAGSLDPLGIAKQAGGQVKSIELLQEARAVHERVKALGTIRAACEAIGSETNRDGSKSGAIEKNYKRHRSAIEAGERFYAALRENRPPDGEDLKVILRGK